MTHALTAHLPPRWPWIRDFALVGAATGFGAPLAAMVFTGFIHQNFGLSYVALGTVAGLASGALMGNLVRWGLARRPGWSKLAFIALGVGFGALWGAAVGAVAGVAAGYLPAIAISAGLAVPVGAAQLGWFGISYAVRTSRRRPVKKLVAIATVAAPLLALVTLYLPHFFV